jgi:biotin carboxyl carrier protein
MEYEFTISGEKRKVQADWDGKTLKLDSGDGAREYAVTDLGEGRFLLRHNSRTHRVVTLKADHKIFVVTDHDIYSYGVPSGKDSDSFGENDDGRGDKSKVTAPMPGKVIKLMVKKGDRVEPKQRLVIVEAMKMENPVVAPFKAEVVKVNCSEGQLVDSDTLLIELNEIE